MNHEDFVLEATDHYYKGEFDRAIDALEKAIELKPDFAEAWYNKGITFSVMGRVEEEISMIML
jgi:tetratricopeptide (TPR) repeat protein